jgi:hypothetical protein
MNMNAEGEVVRPREERLASLAELGVTELAETLDRMMTVTVGLGEHLADIAELVGLDRDVEDLAITPRVRELVKDPRVRGRIRGRTTCTPLRIALFLKLMGRRSVHIVQSLIQPAHPLPIDNEYGRFTGR